MPTIRRDSLGMIILALVAVLAMGAIGIVVRDGQDARLPDSINATPIVGQREPDLLVDAQWLDAHRSDEMLIVDLSDAATYAAGHIPGAVSLHWRDAMSPDADTYGQARGSIDLGVPIDHRIVVYDDSQSERAAWFVWVLRANGYSQAVLLDGGLAAWQGAGGDLSTQPSDAPELSASSESHPLDYAIGTEALEAALGAPDLRLVDVRSDDAQQDTVEDAVPVGQIPGSRQIAVDAVMREDGTFRSGGELTDLFRRAGLTPNDEIVIYGHYGSDTGSVWIALHRAGFDSVRVYDAGYVGWASDPSRPVEPIGSASTPAPGTPAPEATPISTPQATPVERPAARPIPTERPRPDSV